MNADLLNHLRTVAFDRYLALWLSPPPSRDCLLALFSLEAELDSLPGKVSNPTLGVIRVTWWRDALLALEAKPAPANPILEALEPYKAKAALLADYAETFDAAFYEEEVEARLATRRDFLAVLLMDCFAVPLPAIHAGLRGEAGPETPAALRLFAAAQHEKSRLQLVWQAFKLAIWR